VVRQGLAALLDRETDMQVVGEAETGWEVIELARELKPDIVIMDVSMPGLNGIEATKEVLRMTSGVKVLALSVHCDKRFVWRMLQAGASGYLLKDCAADELVRAIHTVSAGQSYLSPKIADTVIESYKSLMPATDLLSLPLLTTKERQVLQLVAEGKTTKEIAYLFQISIKTIETHREHVMKKLNLRSVADLTKFAIREGLTSLGD